jgi:hypothetical protein
MKGKATKNSDTQAQRLPDAEWNFSDQLRNSKDVSLIRGVFFYEYSRLSPKLRKLILNFRHTPRPHVPGWEKVNYSILDSAEKDKLRRETNGWDFTGELAEALMNNPHYPETSALQMLKTTSPSDGAKQWFCTLGFSPAIRLCSGITEAQNMKHALAQAWGNPGIEYRFNGAFQAQEFESVFPLAVDWRSSDKQIITWFRDNLLGRRPERFWKFKNVSHHQVVLGELCDQLPFTFISALDWLGTLRRFEASNRSWKFFLGQYDPRAKAGIDHGDRDYVTWRQNQIDRKTKASKILTCLESGVPLDPKDFRK